MGWLIGIMVVIIVLNIISVIGTPTRKPSERDIEFRKQCDRHDPPEAYVDLESSKKIRDGWQSNFDRSGDIDM